MIQRLPSGIRATGFTLIELMVAVALIAILIGIAAPSFREAMMNVRISGQANDFMADLQLARSEAVKRNQTVFVCASSDQASCNATSWADGWIVFPDLNANGAKDAAEAILKARGALEGNNTFQSANHQTLGTSPAVPYRPTGLSIVNTTISFVLCDERTTPNSGRRIQINNTGRAQTTRVTCPTAP